MPRLFLQNRRTFVKAGAAFTTSAGLLPYTQAVRANDIEPHFFLHLFFPGGMDATCAFDARPMAMTAAEQQINYIGEDPVEMTGKNGGRTLRSNLVKPILPFFDQFSLINGIIMAPDFDGHEDNQSLLLTGNPLGGTSFHGTLGTHLKCPVSTIINGARMVSDSKVETIGGVRMNSRAAAELSKNLGAAGLLDDQPRLNQFLRDRFSVKPNERGSFAKTKLLMERAVGGINDLSTAIGQLESSPYRR